MPADAIERFQKALAIAPSHAVAHYQLGKALVRAGRALEAVPHFEEALKTSPEPGPIYYDLAQALLRAGRKDEAVRILGELQELASQKYVSAYFRVLIHTALGERDQALEWLEKAYEERSEWLVWLKVDPKLDSLRSDPRFTSLVQRVGLP